jgi:hypothetical protein
MVCWKDPTEISVMCNKQFILYGEIFNTVDWFMALNFMATGAL